MNKAIISCLARYAYGLLESRDKAWKWELRNAGTAFVARSGEVFFVADPAQVTPLPEQ